jgi:hypothetical protein
MDGGGGGGGYGAGGGGFQSGGGGGSSFAISTAISKSSVLSSLTGNGQVTITYDLSDPNDNCGTSGSGGGGGPNPGATPELDSVVLFGSGLSGLAAYALMRLRARRRT